VATLIAELLIGTAVQQVGTWTFYLLEKYKFSRGIIFADFVLDFMVAWKLLYKLNEK